jgi:DNA-binding CsgD family transcriptional regulator
MPSTSPTGELSPSRQSVKEYTEKGLTPREIAQLLGISTQRVYVHLRKLGIEPAGAEEEVAS